jgi:hypothetical protein
VGGVLVGLIEEGEEEEGEHHGAPPLQVLYSD